MSEYAELVKRLRDEHLAMTRNEAADRIEALEQQVADLLADVPCACGYDNPTDVCMKHLPLVRNLTAKLAKAVEALEVIRDRQYYRMGPGITAQVIARATLAEIEGEKG
jgi:hypothetical protein